MRKVFISIFAWFCAINLQAQNDSIIYQQIEAAGTSIISMECTLLNQMTRSSGQSEKTGSVKYVADNKIAAQFEDGSCVLMNGNRIKIKIGIFNGTFRTDRGRLIGPLSRMLVYAVKGQCLTMAEENSYNIALATDTTSYKVTLTTKKKSFLGIGYKQAVFEYAKDNKRLKSILLIDYKDNHDYYYFENQVFDNEIDEKNFEL